MSFDSQDIQGGTRLSRWSRLDTKDWLKVQFLQDTETYTERCIKGVCECVMEKHSMNVVTGVKHSEWSIRLKGSGSQRFLQL